MSETRWHYQGVQVDSYAGPANTTGEDRRRLQIATADGTCSLTISEWRSLVQYIRLVGNEPFDYVWIDRPYDSGLVRDGIMTCVELRDQPLL